MYRYYRLICLFREVERELSSLLVTSSVVTTHEGGIIIVHHRDKGGQRGEVAKHRLLCVIPNGIHPRIASLMDFFDAFKLRTAATSKTLLYR
jgi:hypothetical protein